MFDRWNVKGYNRPTAVAMTRGGMNPLVAVFLASRGVGSIDEARRVLADGPELISDPMALRDMDKAAARVELAISRGERVTVYGDYDVDGITSSCILADYLESRGVDARIYIPDRLEEGYGVNAAAIDTIRAGGTGLVVTVDCGITAAAEVRRARELGMDVVITDHHECGDALPEAAAVVDPRRPDCPSPYKELAGVGVAFKLICALEGPGSAERVLARYGDLVAIGTIADVMPVTGENRVLIKRGLQLIREGRRPGIRELCAASGLEGKSPTVTNVGFVLAPRINAAGRLGNTALAVNLLRAGSAQEAAPLAQELCALNRERQRLEGEMYKDALSMMERMPAGGKPVVLASGNWHQGVCGIVASRVAERFHLPAVMICVKDGVGRGSCRSVEGFNLYEALAPHRDILLNFGGHEMAAGLTVEEGKIDALRQALAESFEAAPKGIQESVLNVDFEVIKPRLLEMRNLEAMSALEPYGSGNAQPVLCMRDVRVETVTPLSEGKRTKLWLRAGERISEPTIFEAVSFSKGPEELGVTTGILVDIAFTPQINEFRGRRNVQLNLADLRRCQ